MKPFWMLSILVIVVIVLSSAEVDRQAQLNYQISASPHGLHR